LLSAASSCAARWAWAGPAGGCVGAGRAAGRLAGWLAWSWGGWGGAAGAKQGGCARVRGGGLWLGWAYSTKNK
jgi:hypothetical protein